MPSKMPKPAEGDTHIMKSTFYKVMNHRAAIMFWALVEECDRQTQIWYGTPAEFMEQNPVESVPFSELADPEDIKSHPPTTLAQVTEYFDDLITLGVIERVANGYKISREHVRKS